MSVVWQLDGVRKTFGAKGQAHVALDGVDLRVRAGERVGVIGESGSGKTTLARAGLGLVPLDGGRLHLFGEDTSGWSRRQWRAVRSRAQLLFQDPRAMLNPGLSIGALLRESARLHRPDTPADTAVSEILDAVGLGDRGRALPHELSGGERRRAGLARVLLARPALLVLDEPTAGLDAGLKANLVDLALDRAGPECALVLISHDLPLVTWATERVVVMDRGQVVDRFRADALDDHLPHPRTASLLAAAGLRPGEP